MWLWVSVVISIATAGIAFCPSGLGSSPNAATVVKLAHLLSFATSLGATLWAIFVGGFVMFLHLPRHIMGRLRGKMFPACFVLNAACSAVSAATFAWLHYPWEAATTLERRQIGLLVAIGGFDLANLLLFTPRTLMIMQKRHIVERGLGIGKQIFLDGWQRNARAAMSDASLAAANRRFSAAHNLSAVAVLASIAGLVAHSCYLAGKLVL
ncbi:unnamed protein product [Alopecurus aequalis]